MAKFPLLREPLFWGAAQSSAQLPPPFLLVAQQRLSFSPAQAILSSAAPSQRLFSLEAPRLPCLSLFSLALSEVCLLLAEAAL
jgi:hypothetical protein